MRTYVKSPFLVPFSGGFDAARAKTKFDKAPKKQANIEALEKGVAAFDRLQQKLYAQDQFSLLLVFQALDAAGKDGAMRAILRGINPAGCEVSSFKAPTAEELDHDFLWRVNKRLPERGRIGVWNRSHYEEVLVVKVNPQFLGGQRLPALADLRPGAAPPAAFWNERYDAIVNAEKHWAQNGTVVVKFWLNVSREEQRQRLIERGEDPAAQWKFRADDVATRKQWPAYMKAYSEALGATSRPWAPWYAIPADSKSFARRSIIDIVVRTLNTLPLAFPRPGAAEKREIAEALRQLKAEE